MDLIDAYNAAEVGEFIGHPNPSINPITGDIIFQKTDTATIKTFLTQVARHPAINDAQMADNSWYAKKSTSINTTEIVSETITNIVDDGTTATFDVVISASMTSAAFATFQAELAKPLKEVALTTVVQ